MTSIRRFLQIAALACLCAVLAMAGGKKKKPEDAGAVIAGSVFHAPGFALPEATVTLTRRDDPKHKKVAQQTTTDRGEFAFQVPSDTMVYVVKASAKGYRPQEKEASVNGPDSIDLTFNLEPETKK